MKKTLFALPVLILLAGSLLAQEPAAQEPAEEQPVKEEPVREESGLVQITPKDGGWVITELFATISQYTGESIVFDPVNPAMKKKIQFEGVQTVPREKLFEWFQSLLSFHRLILVPVGPDEHEQWMALDVNAPQIQSRPIFLAEDEILDWGDRDGVYVVTTITVKNLTDTSRARNALAQLTTRQIGRINDVPGNLAFVVADFAPVVASMYKLLRAMDVKPMEYTSVGETYRLKYAVASEVEPILLDLLQSAQPTARTSRGGATTVPSKPEPRIIADTRQDAIIVYAVPEDHERVAELIELLDQAVLVHKGNIHIRPVKHTNAAELADILTELIRGTGLGTSPR
ncbi:MAG: secretin N-terminal domain-containing protein, partial [Planctomycetota bacterium]